MLFDQAANAGQSQTSGFGHAFGRKKRFKEPSLNVRAHAATGVRHLEAHEGPRAGLFMAASLGFINLDGKLARFKIPERIIISVDPLPRLGTGKIDRRALKAQYAQ